MWMRTIAASGVCVCPRCFAKDVFRGKDFAQAVTGCSVRGGGSVDCSDWPCG